MFHQKVFDGGLSGTTVAYSLPQFDALLARAVRWYLLARATQATSGAKLTVALAHSNSGMASEFKPLVATAPIANATLNTNTINLIEGSLRHTDVGVSVPGAFVRAEINLFSATDNANVELWITGRTDD